MSTATDMVALYIAAEKAILEGKQFSVRGKSMTRENLQEVIAGRKEWEARVRAEKANVSGGSSLYSVADFR
jgi:hypothetical protein